MLCFDEAAHMTTDESDQGWIDEARETQIVMLLELLARREQLRPSGVSRQPEFGQSCQHLAPVYADNPRAQTVRLTHRRIGVPTMEV